ncbi:serine/threonine-protein kinase [Nonomuraea turkmeniaca]|nr:serine/threonine-protein kinase [Nonomuraea turkmeniaca]
MAASRHEGCLLAGRYRLKEELGHGGMGRVWRGHDELLDRPVAVKEVTLDQRPQGERETLMGRTMSEARLAARLSHPNIATVYDVVVADERPWIVLQLVSAPTLADVLAERGPLPPATVARIGLQILAALQTAHAAGIVHRDVKPANILLDAGGRHAVLTDFGLAISLEQPVSHTEAGIVVGTPAFIAPERARGGPPTPQTDLWSLGVTLYIAVEGRHPFDEGCSMATLSAVLTADPAPFKRAGSLAPLIIGLLAKDPGRRTSIEETRRQLHRVSSPRVEQLPQTGAIACDSTRASGAGCAPPRPRPAGHPSARCPQLGRAADQPAGSRRLLTPARCVAATAAMIISALAAAFWPGDPGGRATAHQRIEAGMPSSQTASPTAGLVRSEPVTVSRYPATRDRGDPPRIRRDSRGTGSSRQTDSHAASLPPGQAKKLTGKTAHGHKPPSAGKARGRGHK